MISVEVNLINKLRNLNQCNRGKKKYLMKQKKNL